MKATDLRKKIADNWFSYLQTQICNEFEFLENKKIKFKRRDWKKGMIKEGGGTSYLMVGGKIFDKVLELGSGCGYQSAVLSYFCEQVHAIERIKPLVAKSRENLSELKINNVLFKHGDGYIDWDQDIKYDGVLCAAAPRQYPHDLLDCLKVNSKIVIPVGNSKFQQLHVITKLENDEVEEKTYDEVAFVPMLPGTSSDGNDS